MKYIITLLLLTITAVAADYPLTAHVVASNRTSVQSTSQGQWQMPKTRADGIGKAGAVAYTSSDSTVTEIKVGNLVYSSEMIQKHVTVGTDYPARLDKHNLVLLVGDKEVKFRVSGVREDK